MHRRIFYKFDARSFVDVSNSSCVLSTCWGVVFGIDFFIFLDTWEFTAFLDVADVCVAPRFYLRSGGFV